MAESKQKLVELGALLLVWYGFGAASNIYCKQFLSEVASPITLTVSQYLVGVVICALYGLFFAPSEPEKPATTKTSSSSSTLKVATSSAFGLWVVVCLTNAFGHLMTNWSMMSGEVSFTHTIKAAEPIFSFFLAIVFMKSSYTPLTLVSIVTVVVGIMIATASEARYSHLGLLTAMLSNALFSSRNVFTKMLLTRLNQKEDVHFGFYYFLVLSLSGVGVLLPLWIVQQFFSLVASNPSSPSVIDLAQLAAPILTNDTITTNPKVDLEGFLMFNGVVWLLVKASVTHTVYNVVSFFILANVSAVTHAISNAMRRVVIIAVAVLVFGNPISLANLLGTALAIIGVTVYGLVSQKQTAGRKKPAKTTATIA